MIFGKKAVIGEGIIMIYRLLLISFIAFIILGVSSIFYSHYIDVRDVEAQIMAREVVDCISPKGTVDLDSFPEEFEKNLLIFCGFEDFEVYRFYVRAKILRGDSGEAVETLTYGDSGVQWVKSIFEKNIKAVEKLRKYEPGIFRESYPTFVNDSGDKFEGVIGLEVLVNNEF